MLRFRPRDGDAFNVQVTGVGLDPAKQAALTPQVVKASVAQCAKEPLRQSVEKDAVLVALVGAESRGHYYSLTDRAPGHGYMYVSQGIFVTGELMTTFTILHRAPSCPGMALILEMLAGARYLN